MRTTTAKGAVTLFDFDAAQTFPVRIQDPLGNTTNAEHDYRVCRVKQLTDASGSVYHASYDPLARSVAVVEPGDSTALPTHAWEYGTALPVEARLRQRAETGDAATIVTREIFDGDGRLLVERFATVAPQHQGGGAPDIDLGYHAGKSHACGGQTFNTDDCRASEAACQGGKRWQRY